MFKKVLRRSILYQCVLMVVLLSLVFAIVGVYDYQQMREKLQANLDKAENIPFYEYFPGEGNKSSVRYEKKIAAVYVWKNSLNIMISNEDFCPEEIKEYIVHAAGNKSEGQFQKDGYYIAYRKITTEKGTMIYVYDFTEDYRAYRNSVIIIIMLAVMVSALVIFFCIYFTKRNMIPMRSAFEKQKELIANASHELKTPLTILATQSSIVSTFDELSDEHKKWVEGIDEQVGRMRSLINEMLELARFEAVRNEDSFCVLNMKDVVDKVVLGTEALAFEAGVECVTKTVDRAMVYADPDGMEKVMYTLMENAVKYTPRGEHIYVRLYIESNKVVLVVRNTGVALPKEDIPFLFDRFYRGDKSHPSTNNFGLGLSIAEAIVDANKGKIGCNSVDNGKEKYTEFIVNMKQLSEKQIIKKEKRKCPEKKASSRRS